MLPCSDLCSIIRGQFQLTSLVISFPVRKLHISRNSFPEGTIPDEIYEVETLESLQISYNGFGGSILPDVGNLGELKEFWAGSNDITGQSHFELPLQSSFLYTTNDDLTPFTKLFFINRNHSHRDCATYQAH